METIRDIRIRLKSIDSTKKITESMRMIATRKVQRTKQRMEQNRAYFEQSADIIKNMSAGGGFKDSHFLAGNEYKEGETPGRPVIIVITGDRGLCGGYNVNAAKAAGALAEELGEADFITIGTKGRDYFRRRKKNILNAFKGLSENPFYRDAQSIGEIVLNLYNSKSASRVYLIYTKYISMLSQTAEPIKLLPLDVKAEENTVAKDGKEIIYDTNPGALLGYAVAAYVNSSIFGAMLESAVCEQCARLTGMDSAVKNSEKIIDSLTLQYNQMRQSAITQEIAEIVGGANAVEKD
ncbi:MAG: ATP synthase F1 subunit gamma [Oscillospiraceae bacterium]|nr:ATP synthase F1 subunit gamma [Oscillospiraceae bacterium]